MNKKQTNNQIKKTNSRCKCKYIRHSIICSHATHDESFSIFWNGEHCLPILSLIFELKTKTPFRKLFDFSVWRCISFYFCLCFLLLFVWDSVFPRVLVHYVMASFVLCFYHYYCYNHFSFFHSSLLFAALGSTYTYMVMKKAFIPFNPFTLDPNEKILGKNEKSIEKLTVLLLAAIFFSFHSCILILIMTRFVHVRFFSSTILWSLWTIYYLFCMLRFAWMKKIVIFIKFSMRTTVSMLWKGIKRINKNNLWIIRCLRRPGISGIISVIQEKWRTFGAKSWFKRFSKWYHVHVTLFLN